jgi:hypothetical protein
MILHHKAGGERQGVWVNDGNLRAWLVLAVHLCMSALLGQPKGRPA